MGAGVKSRTMGPVSSNPSINTSPKKRLHPKPMSTPKSKYTKSKPPSDGICYYKNHMLFSCLCIWSMTIIIWLLSNYKASHTSTATTIISAGTGTKSRLLIDDKEPAWKHPIQPWDILPRPPKGPPPPMKCTWKGPIDGFLSGCAGDSCRNHNSIDEAKEACSKDELCTGIIKVAKNREVYQMRSGGKVSDSPSGEQSWTKTCVVDQAKLDEIHKNEMNKLDGKAVTDKKKEKKKIKKKKGEGQKKKKKKKKKS